MKKLELNVTSHGVKEIALLDNGDLVIFDDTTPNPYGERIVLTPDEILKLKAFLE